MEPGAASMREARARFAELLDDAERGAARGMPGAARAGRARRYPPGRSDRPGPWRRRASATAVLERPHRTFDLDQPPALLALYETVLQEASRPDDLTSYLNGETLVAVWPDLFLPKGVRRAREDQHPQPRAARLAAA
jgi:hypothetical protein